ncbi:MAG TPA: hypothetical protein VH207_13175 [Chthoniobacterales bacterium]|nr:hypothetical protein [Chthoniobacterales bacterium]
MKRSWAIAIAGLVILAAVPLVLLLRDHSNSGRKNGIERTVSAAGAAQQSRGGRPSLTNKEEDRLLLGDIAKVPFQELYSLLQKRTPAEIAKLAEQFESLPRSSASDAKIAAFYKAWASFDSKAALDSALALSDQRFRTEAISAILRGADPTTAGELAQSIKQLSPDRLPASEKTRFLASAVSKWAQAEPLAAASFLEAIGAKGLDFTSAFSSAAHQWALQDPAAAVEWAQRHPDGYGDLALQGAINGWWEKDPKAAEAWVTAQIAASGSREMTASFASTLFRSDPEHARAWARSLPTVAARQVADTTLAQLWALDDPQAATQWAANLPAEERGSSVGVAARIWAKQDPEAAGDFLNSLGSGRDEAVASFSIVQAFEEPAVGLTWAATIADSASRLKTEEIVARQWLQTDPNAARTWIQNSSLPAADKARLLDPVPGQ